MEKPEDIPQDVWDRAEAVAKETARNAMRDPLMPYYISAQPLFARAILSAVEEENEACAAIGDNPDAWMAFEGDFEANQVAAAIRNRRNRKGA